MEGKQTLRLIVLNHLDDEGQEMVQVSDGDVTRREGGRTADLFIG